MTDFHEKVQHSQYTRYDVQWSKQHTMHLLFVTKRRKKIYCIQKTALQLLKLLNEEFYAQIKVWFLKMLEWKGKYEIVAHTKPIMCIKLIAHGFAKTVFDMIRH